MSKKLNTRWLNWVSWAILILNLLHQIVNFIGVGMAGHYYIHDIKEALLSVVSEENFSYNIVMHWVQQMMSDMSREAILNLLFAIVAIVLFALVGKKNMTQE